MNQEEQDTFGIYKVSLSGEAVPDATQGPGPALMGATTLVGNDVYNLKSEDLGDIKEIMLDMRSGRVGYAVLSFGGFLGMGEKLFAVPWDALKLDTVNKRFVLNVEKDRLASAPGSMPTTGPIWRIGRGSRAFIATTGPSHSATTCAHRRSLGNVPVFPEIDSLPESARRFERPTG